jgi:tripartite-type tricarboxylate transporter receptor subunit TctC
MLPSPIAARFCIASLMIFGAGAAGAQNYPVRPIRIVTPGAGGSADFVARLLAHGLAANLGQQVVVDNRPNGVIPGEIVARAMPDGYTLVVSGNSLWIGPLMQVRSPFDPVKDFAPVTLAATSPTILVMHPSVAAKSVRELMSLARARPGTLNYATGGNGSSSHLAAELFKAMAGVNMMRVPYKTNATQIADLLGGQVHLMFAPAAAVVQHLKSDRLTALAVTSAQPSELLPGLPTVSATGLPGYESVSILGAFAPARTPASIILRLNQEMVRVLNQSEVKQKFFNAGSEVVASSPGHFAATVKSEMERLGKVIKDAGIREE